MPYILLAVMGVAIFAYALGHVPTRPLAAALVGMGASLGLSDIMASGLLRLYTFRPHFFAEMRRDNGLGVLLADFIFVPLAYASLVLLFPRYRVAMTIAFVALLTGLEALFLRLGFFGHDGWRIWYTPLLFIARCAISLWWLGIFEHQGYTRVFRWLVVVSTAIHLWVLWVAASSAVARLWNMRLGVLDPFRDAVLAHSLLHGPPFVIGLIACTMIGGVRKSTKVAVLVVVMALYLTGLEWLGLWHDRPPWSPLASAVVIGGLALALLYLDAWMAQPARPRIPAWKPPT